MDVFPLVFASGWASGVNAYLVVLIAGLVGRYGDVGLVPEVLQRSDVLVAAGVMFALEFVADKIPYVDSIWDGVSTVIRPTIGAIVGALIAGDAGTLNEAVGAVTGGGTALVSHLVKAGFRLGVNASPEPVTNVATSVVEDGAVTGVALLAWQHPWAAAAIAGVLLVFGATLVVVLWRRVRRAFADLRARWSGAPPVHDVTDP